MTALQPLNMTIAQIEDELRAGKTAQAISREWSEPMPNVLAVLREMQADGRLKAPPAEPTMPVRLQPVGDKPFPAIGELLAAARRSDDRRIVRLGERLVDLVAELRDRLAAERNSAEARAEVARLEAELTAARAKLRSGRGGVRLRVA